MRTTTTPPAPTTPWRLILASASPARAQVLAGAGITFATFHSQVDEDAALDAARSERGGELSCAEQVATLAAAKASAVAGAIMSGEKLPAPAPAPTRAPRTGEQLVIIGCDSLLEAGGEVFGKPHTAERARRRAHNMRGTVSTLHTGHHLCELTFTGHGWRLSGQVGDVSRADVVFGHPSDVEIERYIASGEPLEVAGGFTIDGLGGPFIEEIHGDPHGVIGLSLPLLRRLLERLGKSVTDLWDSHK